MSRIVQMVTCLASPNKITIICTTPEDMSLDIDDPARNQSPKAYLYVKVAEAHLGKTPSIIVASLILFGRLTAKELSKQNDLPLKLVKTSLVSLIQLNCIQYWKDEGRKDFHYSLNEEGIILLLLAGEIVAVIKSLHGEDDAEIVQNIIENGSIQVDVLLESLESETLKHKKMEKLMRLHGNGWVKEMRKVDYNPVEDVWDNLYKSTLKLMARSASTSEIKRIADAKEKTRSKFDQLFPELDSSSELFYIQGGIRKLKGNAQLTFNLARYERHLRSRAFVDLAGSRLGLITSKIYGVCCGLVENKSPPLNHWYRKISALRGDPEKERIFFNSIENKLVESKHTVFSVQELANTIPKDLDIRNSILTQNFAVPRKRVNEELEAPDLKRIKLEDDSTISSGANGRLLSSIEPHSRSPPLELLTEHLRILCSSRYPFLVEVSPGNYTVPFQSLSQHVASYHYDTLIKTTLGNNALRVLNCVRALKLVDEKAISNTVLLKDKTVKSELYKLVNANVLETQEIPRSVDRAASKTFFLFRHKPYASHRYVHETLAFSMAMTLDKISDFKQGHKILLEKCDREDVKGHEEELLLESELRTLKELQTREFENLARMMRLKWLHFIFGALQLC